MKQKRTYSSLLLVVAVLCLGIVYAVVSGVTLTVGGEVSAKAGDGKVDVQITQIKAATGSEVFVTEEPIINADKISASFKVENLTKEGDTATIEFEVENKSSDIAATLLTPSIIWANNKWFSATCIPTSTSLAKAGNAGSSTKVTVVVELLRTPVSLLDQQDATDTVTITINANPVDNR